MSRLKQKSKEEIFKIFDLAVKNFTYEDAVNKIEKILNSYPDLEDDRILCKLGFLYDHLAINPGDKVLRKKYEDKAMNYYQQALKFAPESVGAIWGIGRIWWHRKNKKALVYARKAASVATKRDPGMYPLFMNVAVVYETLGNYRRAEYWYKRIIKNNPNFFGSLYGLVNLYYDYSFANKDKKIAKLLPELIRLYKKEVKKIDGNKSGEQIKGRIDTIIEFLNRNK